jgi:DNA topoisomerase-1
MTTESSRLLPPRHARAAGLRYVCDEETGIRRVRAGRGFAYRDARGRLVRDPAVLARIRTLVIPPAWTEVWICASPHGHIQATGRDARGRKQYRYHPRWTAVRDEAKYGRLETFGRALPLVRRRVRRDLNDPSLSRARVLATVLSLLEATCIRVGNEEYARTNGSFGLTTLRDRHVEIHRGTLRFRFRAKSGVFQSIDLHDPRLARIVKRCQDLPGQTLFQYLDRDGCRARVGSDDVNAYVREITGQPFTAKDFRTWAGTVHALNALREVEPAASATGRKQQVVAAIDLVAGKLGNTRAVCRRCYIHPRLVESFLAEGIGGAGARPRAAIAGLSADEMALLYFLARPRPAIRRRRSTRATVRTAA